jgi:hypothetical protein
MPVGIRAVRLETNPDIRRQSGAGVEGAWLKSYDPEAHDGRGDATWTNDPAQAQQFASAMEAHRFWRQPSRTRPRRADGQPNRPLTAFSVSIEALP